MLTAVACQGEGTAAQRRGPQWGRSKVLSSPRPRETQGVRGRKGRGAEGQESQMAALGRETEAPLFSLNKEARPIAKTEI